MWLGEATVRLMGEEVGDLTLSFASSHKSYRDGKLQGKEAIFRSMGKIALPMNCIALVSEVFIVMF